MSRSIEYTNYEYWMKIRHPYACGIELTPYCNFKCCHCYLQDSECSELLSKEDIFKILDILYDTGLLFIYFTGGEIFTREDFIEIYLYAKRKGFIVELLSNISLLNDELLSIFDRYPPSVISISVYGASEETYKNVTGTAGNYRRVKLALDKLHYHKINFEIKFIGLQYNIQDFYAIESLARKYKVQFKHNFEVFPTLNKGLAPLHCMLDSQEIVNFEKEYPITVNRWGDRCLDSNPPDPDYRLFPCDIAQSSFIIDCQGYMEPCNKLRLKKHKILNEGFKHIWSEYDVFKKMVAPSSFKCAACSMRSICTPCPAENLLTNDSLYIPAQHMCDLAAARMKEFSNIRYSSPKMK